MSQDLDARLSKAVVERDRLKAEVQRIQGRKEAAVTALEEVRKEIMSKNLDPDSLEQTLDKVESAFRIAVEKFEEGVENTHKILTPYLELK
jgi:predicted  nucleic acid-binding Zn-ribbon protein